VGKKRKGKSTNGKKGREVKLVSKDLDEALRSITLTVTKKGRKSFRKEVGGRGERQHEITKV